MAAGLPVVTTAQGVSGLSVTNGEHYLGSEDASGLATLIVEYADKPARLEQIGEAGRVYVRARHDWSVSAAQLEVIYTRFSQPKQGSRSCV